MQLLKSGGGRCLQAATKLLEYYQINTAARCPIMTMTMTQYKCNSNIIMIQTKIKNDMAKFDADLKS